MKVLRYLVNYDYRYKVGMKKFVLRENQEMNVDAINTDGAIQYVKKHINALHAKGRPLVIINSCKEI